jgi:hypothetical protein
LTAAAASFESAAMSVVNTSTPSISSTTAAATTRAFTATMPIILTVR